MTHCILNFHGVGPILRPVDEGEQNCWLEVDFFEAVLDLVREHPHVRLTVDDGNASDVTHILPALLRRGLRAIFFVCSGRLGQPLFLTRDDLNRLRAARMEIGSHGVNHQPWRQLPEEQLRVELEASRRDLEAACGGPIVQAACPFGSYDRRVLRALRRAGYERVYTSDGGVVGTQNRLLPRTTVTRRMSCDDVRRLVNEGPGAWAQLAMGAKRLWKRLR